MADHPLVAEVLAWADVLRAAGNVRRRRIDALLRAGGEERIDHPGGTLADHARAGRGRVIIAFGVSRCGAQLDRGDARCGRRCHSQSRRLAP